MVSLSGHTRQVIGTSATDTESDTLPRAGFFIGWGGVGVAVRKNRNLSNLQTFPRAR